MKKYCSILLALSLLLCLMPLGIHAADSGWDGKSASAWAGGNGTEASPYLIATAGQLQYLSDLVNGGEVFAGTYFLLTADISLNDPSSAASWDDKTAPDNVWTPIGSRTTLFAGTFDGNGHTIRGIYTISFESHRGLFGGVDVSGVIQNVCVDDSYIGGSNCTGAIAALCNGAVLGCSTGSNVRVLGLKNGTSYGTGGIVGRCQTTEARIEDCLNRASVESNFAYHGGVVGAFAGTIRSCVNLGKVVNTSTGTCGGVVGIAGASSKPAEIEDCVNLGSVSGETAIGGIVGTHGNVDGCTMTGCYNAGAISGTTIGALIGQISAKSSVLGAAVSGCAYDESVAAGVPAVGKNASPVSNPQTLPLSGAQCKGAAGISAMKLNPTQWTAAEGEYPLPASMQAWLAPAAAETTSGTVESNATAPEMTSIPATTAAPAATPTTSDSAVCFSAVTMLAVTVFAAMLRGKKERL